MAKNTEDLPLSGISVLVTRPEERSAEVVRELTARGAEVRVIPALFTVPVAQPEGLDRAIARIDSYSNIVLTSVKAVSITLKLASEAGLEAADMPPALCVGDKTAMAWKEKGGKVTAVPRRFTALALLEGLGDDLTGRTYLVMRPENVKTELGREMTRRGAAVDEIVIYKTVQPEEGKEELMELLADGAPDVIFFASPSAVEGTVKMTAQSPSSFANASRPATEGKRPEAQRNGDVPDPKRKTQNPDCRILEIPVICIGPTTAQAAEEAGFSEVYFPDEHTALGMVEELMVIAGKITKPST